MSTEFISILIKLDLKDIGGMIIDMDKELKYGLMNLLFMMLVFQWELMKDMEFIIGLMDIIIKKDLEIINFIDKEFHIWSDESKYDGNWQNYKMNEKGVRIWKYGRKYIGNFPLGNQKRWIWRILLG